MRYEEKLVDLRHHSFAMGRFIHLLYFIVVSQEKKLDTILEIGTGRGTSTKTLLYGLSDRKEGHLYSIDLKRGCVWSGVPELKHLWTFIKGDSRKIEWNKEIDILLLDGDFSCEGIKADYEKYEPFVKKGGTILIMNAFRREGAKKLFKEIKYNKSILPLSDKGMGIINK